MSDAANRQGQQIKVILPEKPPELTPGVARALLALLIEMYDEKRAQVAQHKPAHNQTV